VTPVLETERLRLRGYVAGDHDPVAAMLGDPEVMRFIGGEPLNRENAWRRMLALPALWQLLGFGYWIVERKGDRAVIGQVGFADFKRDMTPSIEGIPEAGWQFSRQVHGQGYAAEAMQAALAWADDALGGEFAAIIDHGNEPSIRLARRLGFSSAEEAVYREAPILLFRRPGRSPAASSSTSPATA